MEELVSCHHSEKLTFLYGWIKRKIYKDTLNVLLLLLINYYYCITIRLITNDPPMNRLSWIRVNQGRNQDFAGGGLKMKKFLWHHFDDV